MTCQSYLLFLLLHLFYSDALLWYSCSTGTHVKDKVGVVPEEVEDFNDHEEDKKRHLNVVFIGHVGMESQYWCCF